MSNAQPNKIKDQFDGYLATILRYKPSEWEPTTRLSSNTKDALVDTTLGFSTNNSVFSSDVLVTDAAELAKDMLSVKKMNHFVAKNTFHTLSQGFFYQGIKDASGNYVCLQNNGESVYVESANVEEVTKPVFVFSLDSLRFYTKESGFTPFDIMIELVSNEIHVENNMKFWFSQSDECFEISTRLEKKISKKTPTTTQYTLPEALTLCIWKIKEIEKTKTVFDINTLNILFKLITDIGTDEAFYEQLEKKEFFSNLSKITTSSVLINTREMPYTFKILFSFNVPVLKMLPRIKNGKPVVDTYNRPIYDKDKKNGGLRQLQNNLIASVTPGMRYLSVEETPVY